MLKNKLFLRVLGLITIAMPSLAFAGRFEIIGESSLTHPAEFLKLDIALTGECYDSALNAKKSVDKISGDVLLVLEAFKDTQAERQIQIVPGSSAQNIKTAYVDGKQVTVCDARHAWTNSTTIQFKLTKVEELANLQDSILGAIEKNTIGSESEVNLPLLKGSMSNPIGGVFSDTWDKMSDEALDAAHQNALRQVNVLVRRNPNARVELVKVAPTIDSSGAIIYDRVSQTRGSSTVSLGAVGLKMARLFVFNVD